MTSSNMKKIMQNNIHLNPWVLSKNTNEIVNTCIQKIYKHVPQNFKNELRKPKIAALRPENKGPIRTFQAESGDNQEALKIRPQIPGQPIKKGPGSRIKVNQNQLVDILNASNKHNNQISRKMTSTAIMSDTSKKLLKSPNFRIYGCRRYGSSASSSRSSLFRRFDEKRRQRSQYIPQLSYLVRTMHSGEFDATFAKYLMPIRNQKVKGDLGSLPDAMKVSSSIQNELMCIDAALRDRISVNDSGSRRKLKKPLNSPGSVADGLKSWKHPPPINKFQNALSHLLDDSKEKESKVKLGPKRKPAVMTTEQQKDLASGYNVGPLMPVRQHVPPLEMNTPNQPLSYEKHRRIRMKKLGLIESPRSSKSDIREKEKTKSSETVKSKEEYAGPKGHPSHTTAAQEKPAAKPQSVKKSKSARNPRNRDQSDSDECCYSKSSPLTAHVEAIRKEGSRQRRHVSHFPMVKNIYDTQDVQSVKSLGAHTTINDPIKRDLHHKKSNDPPKSSEPKNNNNSTVVGETAAPSTSQTPKESTEVQNSRLHGPLAMATSQFNSAGNSQAYSGYRYNRSSYFPSSKY